jgi:hypothetical protein
VREEGQEVRKDDPEVRLARIDAHLYFDPLWVFGRMSRSEAYERLARRMGMTRAECHIALMTKEQALSVREHVKAIWIEKEQER